MDKPETFENSGYKSKAAFEASQRNRTNEKDQKRLKEMWEEKNRANPKHSDYAGNKGDDDVEAQQKAIQEKMRADEEAHNRAMAERQASQNSMFNTYNQGMGKSNEAANENHDFKKGKWEQ